MKLITRKLYVLLNLRTVNDSCGFLDNPSLTDHTVHRFNSTYNFLVMSFTNFHFRNLNFSEFDNRFIWRLFGKVRSDRNFWCLVTEKVDSYLSSEIGVTRILQEFVLEKGRWPQNSSGFRWEFRSKHTIFKWTIQEYICSYYFFHQLKYLKTAMKAKETIFFCHFVVIFSLSLDSCDCVEFVCEVATTTIIYAMWRLGYPKLKRNQ